MLAIAIISTVILSIFILSGIIAFISESDADSIGLFMLIGLVFVLITIWILYAR